MNIESKIRVKAVAVYVIVAVAVIVMIFYSYRAKNRVVVNRERLETQYRSLSLTNRLIFFVQNAQNLENKFFTSVSGKGISVVLQEIEDNIAAVGIISDTLSMLHPSERANLLRIGILLSDQLDNFRILNNQLNGVNPVSKINESIRNFEPVKRDTIIVSTTTKDTVVKYPVKRKFFQRIGDIFRAHKDSIVTSVVKTTDTLRRNVSDTLPIIYEVEKIAKRATKDYDSNIRSISKQVAHLVMADRELSSEIAKLLLVLHGNMFDSTMELASKSEKDIEKNYFLFLAGGLTSLLLALFLIIMILADISRGQRARAELEKANRQIRNIMDSRHRLLLAVSHDIKSPLGSIVGYIDIMTAESLQDDGKREYLKSMKNSARHIRALLNNLLEFSSIEQGKEKINVNIIDIKRLAADMKSMFEPLADAKGIHLNVFSEAYTVDGDLMKIKQIVINLLSNAVKYTSSGMVSLMIKYSDNKLLITVEDTGTGIPADEIDKIYKPFVRMESNSDMASGTGLGMYVVKGIIEMLGGSIEVTSKVGEGSKFFITIPASLHEGRRGEINESSENRGILIGERESSALPEGPKRIAVFDDDPAMIKVVALMLEKLGHMVVEEEYNVILTDMEMCDLSGMDVLASSPEIPVVVMTGRSDFSSEEARRLGFAGYLAKPFTFDELSDLFGNFGQSKWDDDNNEIVRVLFCNSAQESSVKLSEALKTEDYAKAQFLCHKMLPMFAQMGYNTDALRRMDMHRGNEYEQWREDVESILSIVINGN